MTGIYWKSPLAKQEGPVAADNTVKVLLQILGEGFVSALNRTGGVREYNHLRNTVHGLFPLGLRDFNLFEEALQFEMVSEKIVILWCRI
jgi:hypothetical protein